MNENSDNPRVSVIITAFKADFFEAALASARRQTFDDLEIIVGDDSPGDGIRRAAESAAAADPRIVYTRNRPALGGPANRMACFARSRGAHVKFLNDDDLLDADCVRRMASCLDAFQAVTLVTSYWRRIDALGGDLGDDRDNARPVGTDSTLDGRSAAAFMIGHRSNFIGGPSAAMFRRNDLADARPNILSFAGEPCLANGDVTMWTHLLSKGDAIYLADSLSALRIHPGQMQRRPGYAAEGAAAWDRIASLARRAGLVDGKAPGRIEAEPLAIKPWHADRVVLAITEGAEALDGGDLNRAYWLFTVAAEAEPRDAWILEARARVLFALGERTLAESEMKRSRALYRPSRAHAEGA
ncbi:MAG TPA: glycosyltransferase [Verrucomicrobiae bacterium]|nr:glycosyltransferase [Verrucomicrobiae bacterium]